MTKKHNCGVAIPQQAVGYQFEKRYAWCDTTAYMRNLVYSEVSNHKNQILLQGDTSATGEKAHKLIFAPFTANSIFDIVDWALTHVGVPYGIGDGPTPKVPYIKIDCSSLITTAKIQTIGPINNSIYNISSMNSLCYDSGLFNDERITYRVAAPDTDSEFNFNDCRGQLLFVQNVKNSSDRHIMIIYEACNFDPQTKIPTELYIVHARGGAWPQGHVRYQYRDVTYIPPHNISYGLRGTHKWTFLKWAN